jgi:hypothetical protein
MKCPGCKQVISSVAEQEINVTSTKRSDRDGVAYVCEKCQTVISVLNLQQLKYDIANVVKRALGK